MKIIRRGRWVAVAEKELPGYAKKRGYFTRVQMEENPDFSALSGNGGAGAPLPARRARIEIRSR